MKYTKITKKSQVVSGEYHLKSRMGNRSMAVEKNGWFFSVLIFVTFVGFVDIK
jgi:hypothetical protein